MSLQSSYFDPVVGLDIHMVAIPAPPTLVPAPMPLPFVGLVFDPMGLLVGTAVSLVFSGSPGIVLVNGLPVTNCGTSVTNGLTLPHLPTPGIAFLSPVAPVKIGDAELFFGSKDVEIGGSLGVRLLEHALSCSDPVRLPTSFVIAIPKGFPVMNMPPSVPDFVAMANQAVLRGTLHCLGALFRGVRRAGGALFRVLREESQFWRALSIGLGGCETPASASRVRTMFARLVRFSTGHPIDVVSGNLFTDVVDVSLPGPLPLTIERVYESARSARAGVLGNGWSHTLDEALFFERGRAVYRCGDGRELEFALFDLPGREMRVGDVVERVPDRLRLRRVARDRFEVEQENGCVHELAIVADGVHRLVRIRSEDRHHAIDLSYDERGLLERVRESGGRLLFFEHDDEGRLVRLKLPIPHGRGWVTHREYQYDAHGDLVRVTDAAGASYEYRYSSHLLVQEADRTGSSFYFEYDGAGESARCIRTWGDGDIYDHVVEYDTKNRRTFVRDSLGAPKMYEYDARGLVTRIVDAEGRTTKYEYDERSLAECVMSLPDGLRSERTYDEHGNLVRSVTPTGEASITYEGRRPLRLVDERGAEWLRRYDSTGHLVEHRAPDGTSVTLEWNDGLLRALTESNQGRLVFEYDEHHDAVATVLGPDAVVRTERDELGRAVKVSSPRGSVMRTQYDAEGRPTTTSSLAGVVSRASYDAEGHVIEWTDGTRHRRCVYGPGHQLASCEEAGTTLRYERDTECRLTGVINEAGERYAFTLDRVGDVREELGFDGSVRRFLRDAGGRATKVFHASGRTSDLAYDRGRLVGVTHSDGSFVRFEYDMHGDLVAAQNESSRVELTLDALGRVIAERMNGHEVRSEYVNGSRALVTTSLGTRVSWLPDAVGQLGQIFFGVESTPAIAIERDALGVERARHFSNGVDQTWTHDAAGRPLARRTAGRLTGASPAARFAPSLGVLAPRHETATTEYEWTGEDLITQLVDSATGTRRYERDARTRLVREQHGAGEASTRELDDVGNPFRAPDGSDREYGAGGRALRREGVTFEHDADGNRTREIDSDGAVWRYEWNGHGLLREIARPDGCRVGFEYDAFARRLAKRTLTADGALERETRFVWDGSTLVHEDDSRTGLTTWHWSPEDGAPIARERDGQRWFVHTDHLGTPAEMFDSRGELVWQMRLDVWGSPEFTAGTADDCAWRWPGQYEDAETGLYYNRHRYYSPDDGRYISQDPIRLDGGIALYAYVDDPTGWIDPEGLKRTPQTRRGFTVYHIYELGAPGARTPVYVGITGDEAFETRQGAHERSTRLSADYEMVPVARGLMYGQARGYEQADIERFETRHPGRIGAPVVPGGCRSRSSWLVTRPPRAGHWAWRRESVWGPGWRRG